MSVVSLSSRGALWGAQSALATLSLFALPSLAAAQEACGDFTCDLGTTCEVGQPSCAAVLCPVDAPDCSDTCSAGEPNYYCQPSECTSDADCSDYMECVTHTTSDCPDTTPSCEGIEEEAECNALWEAWQAQCTPGEASSCQVRWHQSCAEASECGDGFVCTLYENGCSEDEAISEDAPARDAAIECVPQQSGYCEPVEQGCDDDADCLEHWTCGENWALQVAVCSESPEGTSECDDTPTQGPPMVCQPPEMPGGDFTLAATSGLAENSVAEAEPQDDGVVDDGAAQELPTTVADVSAQSGPVAEAEVAAADEPGDGCSVAAPGRANSRVPLGLLGVGLALFAAGRRRR